MTFFDLRIVSFSEPFCVTSLSKSDQDGVSTHSQQPRMSKFLLKDSIQ